VHFWFADATSLCGQPGGMQEVTTFLVVNTAFRSLTACTLTVQWTNPVSARAYLSGGRSMLSGYGWYGSKPGGYATKDGSMLQGGHICPVLEHGPRSVDCVQA
jgi:hypothetical protein